MFAKAKQDKNKVKYTCLVCGNSNDINVTTSTVTIQRSFNVRGIKFTETMCNNREHKDHINYNWDIPPKSIKLDLLKKVVDEEV